MTNDTPLFDEKRYGELINDLNTALENFNSTVISTEVRRMQLVTEQKQQLEALRQEHEQILREIEEVASGLEGKLIKPAGEKKRQPAKGNTKKPAGTKAASTKKKG
jgi:oligoendopeptidase F